MKIVRGFALIVKRIQWVATIPTARAKPLQRSLLLHIAAHFSRLRSIASGFRCQRGAGNAIGGGNWAADRIVPDCVRALQRSKPIVVRNENATRPWQHVLEPLSGYLSLGQELWEEISTKNTQGARLKELASAFNFGPPPGSARSVRDVVAEVLRQWPGKWVRQVDPAAAYEARRLNLSIDKAINLLGWRPVSDFSRAVAET